MCVKVTSFRISPYFPSKGMIFHRERWKMYRIWFNWRGLKAHSLPHDQILDTTLLYVELDANVDSAFLLKVFGHIVVVS